MPSRFGPKPVLTGLRTAVFSGLSLKNWKDQDCGPDRTGPGPVRFIGPMWSLGPDLKALITDNTLCEAVCMADIAFNMFFNDIKAIVKRLTSQLLPKTIVSEV